jgi:hypothetical protein
MSDNIFVKKREFTSLEGFARFIFTLFQFGRVEEHQSVNYWGGHYYLAFSNKASLTVALQDHTGFQDYDYWLSVELATSNSEDEVKLGRELARALALNDFKVARPFSKEDWLYKSSIVRRVVYRKKILNEDAVGESEAVDETLEYFKVP